MKVTLKIRTMALDVMPLKYITEEMRKDPEPKTVADSGEPLAYYAFDDKAPLEFEVTLYKDIEAPDNLWEMLKEWDVDTTEGYTLKTPLFEVGKAGGLVFDVTTEDWKVQDKHMRRDIAYYKNKAALTFDLWMVNECSVFGQIFRTKGALMDKYVAWQKDAERRATILERAHQKWLAIKRKDEKTAEELLATGWRTTEVAE